MFTIALTRKVCYATGHRRSGQMYKNNPNSSISSAKTFTLELLRDLQVIILRKRFYYCHTSHTFNEMTAVAITAAVLFLTAYVVSLPIYGEDNETCGYKSCHPIKEGLINVHIVAHTHDDVGWLKTVDQYYFGSKSDIQKAGVQYILDSVLASLKQDKSRRFIYVETAFLWKWWRQQHDTVKHQFLRLIRNGQLELIGGAWSMNDEATTHYQSIIDQFTWGLRKLNDTFGDCGRPKIGWQIDPFGHSREMASILAQLGYDALFLGRIDYQDKEFRFDSKTPEMVWRASENLGNSSNIFTSVLYNTYSPPPGFCFDVLCSDEPIIDDKRSPDYNVPKRVTDFLDYVKNMTKRYTSHNVLVTMGEDFTYQDAHMWFKNLDKLIHYANQLQVNGSNYNLLYSTPSCYLKAVHDEAKKHNLKFPVKTDDFFPYASDPHSYWTGYFTSKPTIKRFERLGNNFLQVCKQLYALTDLGPEDWADLNVMREAMGVLQHHDAVTGTEKDHVAHDYARILSKGFDECHFTSATALGKIVTKNSSIRRDPNPAPAIPFESCLLTNMSQCAFSENNEQFIVTVYNPLSRPVTHYVRLPVTDGYFKVTDSKGTNLQVQAIPVPNTIVNIPGRFSKATQEIIFMAESLPPLGFKSFYVQKTPTLIKDPKQAKVQESAEVKFNQDTGLISEIYMNGRKIPLQQAFMFYRGAVGDNKAPTNRSSGAYIFRPNGTEAVLVSEKVTNKVFKGDLITEIHQVFNDWLSQIVRIYNLESLIEFDWLIGPIPKEKVNGIEVITKYITNLKSESTFYTDSNGREMLKRVRNFRPTWNLNLTEKIASNYYPVTSKILIRDPHEDLEVAILNDRAQGGTSLKDGEIELMLHRNCLNDDAFGVGEPLDEVAFGKRLVVRGSHYLVAGPYANNSAKKSLAAQERDLAQRKLLQAWTFLSPTNGSTFEQYKTKHVMEYSGLKKPLPDNVHILTLEPWIGPNYLLRLEHYLEKTDDPILSKPVTIDLKEIFAAFDIISYRETTLGANQWLDQNQRFVFNATDKILSMIDDGDDFGTGNYGSSEADDDDDNYLVKSKSAWTRGAKYWRRNQLETNRINANTHVAHPVLEHDLHFAENSSITLNPMQIRTFIIDIKMVKGKNHT
ncbi:hypothetical protein RN001_014872 [Aquatica leii]|uniref:Alpha-mannosidase n=1 Tax=Aquatica leii TaxID=1421715 RepID=A0AAN7P132_9COLE|nr:hypothetical protein RN001_014872 [Aquatica leii]